MSRIHEALRKAEQEKLAGAPAAPAPLPVQPPVEEHLAGLEDPMFLGEMAPLIGSVAPVAVPERPDVPQLFSWELLASRCRQRKWTPSQGMLFLNADNHNQVGTEEFRTLRSRLYHIREKRPLRTILIGSALPAEGKTFVSANLAQTLARQHGRRVVLLDCDLRRSRLHEVLGTQSAPGVSDYLCGEADEFSIVQRGPMENLAFIPGGRSISNPAELIGNGRLELLLRRLGEVFDWVVIDSPPAVPVSDASLIARYCDGILLVIMAAKTPFDLAQRARREFRNMPVLGVVLNRVEAGSTYVSYYYESYGHPGKHSREPGGKPSGR